MYRQKIIIAILIIGCGLIVTGLSIAFTALPSYAVPSSTINQVALHQNSQPDLIIESITLNPTTLSPDTDGNIMGQIVVVIKNQGDVIASGYRVYLYVDPADMPPNQTTDDTSRTRFLDIAAGETNQWRRDVTFTTVNPVIYVWVDRDNEVAEADENNNLLRYPATPNYTPTSTNVPPTDTPVYTATPMPTSTATSTSTSTPAHTDTPTSTNTATSTSIPTTTHTPTVIYTGTALPTSTPTKTGTSTATHTATHTATNTPTNTAAYTPTETATNTVAVYTPTHTQTQTATPTSTATFNPYGPTATPTATGDDTPPGAGDTKTPTPNPADTISPTVAVTDTPILVPTEPNSENTDTPSPDTPTPTPDTPTPTPTIDTPTPTPTTDTPTPTPTLDTPTPTPTVDDCAAAAAKGLLPTGQNADQPHRIFLPITSNGGTISEQPRPTSATEPAVAGTDARAESDPLRIAKTSFQLLALPNNAPTDGTIPNALFMTDFEPGVPLPGPTFEIWVTDDGEPTVMRDDGCGGDVEAGDAVYTAEVFLTDDELGLLETGDTPADRIADTDVTVDSDRELMIIDTSVVDDEDRTFDLCDARGNPDGVWAFKTLIMDMAGTDDEAIAAEFVEDWWLSWSRQTVLPNGNIADERGDVIEDVLDKWLREEESGLLDLDAAPLRLLAIVTRIDLRNNPTPDTGHGGEFRFVWGVLRPDESCFDPTRPGKGPPEFTVIFEYAMPAENTTDVQRWANQIHALQELEFGPDYNVLLESLSIQITGRNVMPDEPNGSAINQVRTNEFLDSPWELREFVLFENDLLSDNQTSRLMLTTTKQTPDLSFNNTVEMATFINNNTEALLHIDPVSQLAAPIHEIPEDLLAASSPENFDITWNVLDGSINDNEARHQFALMTCNGCHTQETNTFFTHVKPRNNLVETHLSAFLTGGEAPDPVDNSIDDRPFNDLERRQDDLLRILHSTRFEIVGVPGLRNRVH